MSSPWPSRTPWERGGVLAAGLLGAALVAAMSFGISEEIEFGGVTGQVTIKGAKKPLPNCEVILQPQFALPDGMRWSPSVRTNERGEFSIAKLPAGLYEAQAFGKAHSASGIQVLVKANRTEATVLPAERTMAELELRVSQRVVSPKEKPQFEISGVTTDSAVNLEVYQVGNEALAAASSLYDVARALSTGRNSKNPISTPGLKRVRKESLKLDTLDLEGAFVETESLAPLPEGIYLLRANHKEGEKMAWLTVTDIALITKSVDRELLAYVVDIQSGQPVVGAPITLFANGRTSSPGATNSEGILRFNRPDVPEGGGAIVGAARGASRAFTWFRWWQDSSETSTPTKLWAKTDRPIYRPGDQIQAKGLARIQTPSGYQTPGQGAVTLTVFDPSEEEVSRQTLPVNSFGAFSFSFGTSTETSGTYRMEMSMNGSKESQYLTVMPFRKPEFTITVTPEKKSYRRGQPISFKVKAEYYTGEPVAGAPVSVQVQKTPFYEWSPLEDGYSPWRSSYGEYVDTLEGRTDASGEAAFTYRPEPDAQKDESEDAQWTFEASTADASGRYFSGKGSALVTRGSLDLEASMESYVVERGSPAQVKLLVKDVETSQPKANQKVKVTLKRVRWVNRAQETKEVETPLKEEEGVTGPDGTLTLPFSPNQEGSYRVTAETVDGGNARILSEAEFWCTSGSWNGEGMESRARIVVDKTTFSPTEDVKGIIQVKEPGGKALLSVEGLGLIQARVVDLKGPVTRFNLGRMGSVAPGAEIRLAYIRGKEYYEASSPFSVALGDRSLKIEVTSDRPEAQPGEVVTYTLKASTPEGQPVKAELSLGVVDEGIFQMAEESSGPLDAFYQPQYSSVMTEYSFPELYLDGEDKGPKNIQLRKNFVDTAFWQPHIATNDQGLATVKVTMPDNLTSWRATVTGATLDSRMGQARANVVVKKDLMIRLNAPAYMIEKDTHLLGAVISNGTDQEKAVEVNLDATGLQLEGSASRTISVPPRSSKRLEYLTVAEDLGEAKLRATALSGPLNDGLEVPVSIRPKARPVTSGESGGFEDGSTKTITLTRDEAAVTGELVVRVDPSPLQALLDIVPSLVDFPYGCVEQTLSRFQPALAAAQLLKSSGAPDPLPVGKLEKVTTDSLKRLQTMQHADGGWGWWEWDESSTLMTAAVLEGLHQARQSGANVSPAMVQKALTWTDDRLKGPRVVNWDQNTPYLAYSRLLWGASPRAVTLLAEHAAALKKKKAEDRSLGEDAQLAIFLRQSGQEALAQEAFARLKGEVESNPESILRESWYWGETRGRVVEAMSLFEPSSPLTRRIIQIAVQDRKSLEQSGTRAMALVVNGVVRALGQTGWQASEGQVTIEAAGQTATAQFGPGSAEPLILRAPLDKLPSGQFEVKITSSAKDAAYVASLSQMVRASSFPAEGGSAATLTRTFHRVITKTKGDGTMERTAEDKASDSFKSGEIYRVRVVVEAKTDLNYVLIEDPIPSGASVLDAEDPYTSGEWSFWWDRITLLQDKAAFFKRNLPKGRHQFEYTVRAETPGSSFALPAKLSLFYQPLEPSTSEGRELKVQ